MTLPTTMNIGVLGTGRLATGLCAAWAVDGHTFLVAGRSAERAAACAAAIGPAAQATTPDKAVVGVDAVLLAVAWTGVEDILTAAGAQHGALAGIPVIEPTNPVDTTNGDELPAPEGRVAIAERVADWAPNALVVKALHLLPLGQWAGQTVPLAGDDGQALRVVSQLVRALGARPAVFGPLDVAYQLEAVSAFYLALARAGVDPHTALIPAMSAEQPA